MTITYPRVVFEEVEFTRDEIRDASLVESFDQLSITVPINQFEMTLYSETTDFSIINPTGRYEPLLTQQPMAVYERVGTKDVYLGQFYLDDWDSESENLAKFICVDILGVLDKLTYKGGIWLTPITFGELIDTILSEVNVDYEIDPDLASETLTGWLPISSYREALQQVAFAASAYVKTARESVIVFGRMTSVAKSTKYIRTGVPSTGQSGVRQWNFRSRYEYSFTAGGAVTQGIRSGVSKTGQSRVWKKRWRPSQWEGTKPTYDVGISIQGEKPTLKLRPIVTGVEVTMHNLSEGDGELTVLDKTLDAGTYEILFSQALHTLSITGGAIDESDANYAIITVSSSGPVLLKGQTYIDSREVYGIYSESVYGRKENVLEISSATMVSSTNGRSVAQNVYDFCAQRYSINSRIFQPLFAVGDAVNIQTQYDRILYGIINSMEIDLTTGFISKTDIIGIIT